MPPTDEEKYQEYVANKAYLTGSVDPVFTPLLKALLKEVHSYRLRRCPIIAYLSTTPPSNPPGGVARLFYHHSTPYGRIPRSEARVICKMLNILAKS